MTGGWGARAGGGEGGEREGPFAHGFKGRCIKTCQTVYLLKKKKKKSLENLGTMTSEPLNGQKRSLYQDLPNSLFIKKKKKSLENLGTMTSEPLNGHDTYKKQRNSEKEQDGFKNKSHIFGTTAFLWGLFLTANVWSSFNI